MTTVDGYFEGPNKELDWHVVDEEFFQNAVDLLNSADILLFGRVTYQMMAAYWPTCAAIADDPVIAERMNNLPKVVFSTTLKKTEWQNSRLVKQNMRKPSEIISNYREVISSIEEPLLWQKYENEIGILAR